MSDKALQLLQQSNAAARAGDDEGTLKAWREFVRELWLPMAAKVPWAPQQEDKAE